MKSKTRGRVAIVQARMGSSRLPNKVLQPIAGTPMLGHVIERLQRAQRIDRIVVATSTSKADEPIVRYARSRGVDVFRGEENDVLDRFYQAAKAFGAKCIVRITADCPLIDPKVVDRVMETFEREKPDYASNNIRYTYPEGLDVEIFSFAALEIAWKEAKESLEREHVTRYLRLSPQFRRVSVERKEDLSHLQYNWSVDRQEDLRLAHAILEQVGKKGKDAFDHETVVELLATRPELAGNLAQRIRNEGYYLGILGDSRKLPLRKRSLKKSEAWHARSEKVIPLATQTFSKASDQYVRGVAPLFLKRGKGAHVWDVDENEYIDYVMALCPLILGYADEAVDEAVRQQMRDGVSFSLAHPLEVELSERLVDLIPCAEMVRFGKNGSDATSGAIRAARAFTGRERIACSGYHGWQDWYVGTTTRNLGVPESTRKLTHPFQYNQIETLERLFASHPGEIAAVILEPMGLELPRNGFLEKVKDLTHRNGALLIFDEIVTGFRFSLGGAQEYFGVTPDLACFGKALANGYPLSAVVGRREVMEIFEEIFFSFTFGGETLSLAAALETLNQLEKRKAIPHIWEQGQMLLDGVNVMARELGLADKLQAVGLPCRSAIQFLAPSEEETRIWKSLFQQEALRRGILFAGGHNPSFAHREKEIETTLFAYRDAMRILAEALREDNVIERLQGEVVQPVFRKP